MKRRILMSICIGAVALAGACSRQNSTSVEQKTDDQKNIVELAAQPPSAAPAAPVSVDGCLSASGDRFMLASFDKDSSKTTVYQLVNGDDQLRNFIGREVRVTGEAEAGQSTETRAVTPPTPAATTGKPGSEAKVSTVEDTKVDTRRLTVASVTPTGDSCTH